MPALQVQTRELVNTHPRSRLRTYRSAERIAAPLDRHHKKKKNMAKTGATKSSSADAAKKKKAKAQKKAQQQRALEEKVAAYDLDPSVALAPFLAKPFSRNGLSMTVAPTTVKSLSASDKKWIWSLLEKNMRPVYGEEKWVGGEAKDKKNEMVDEDTRYLIAREVTAAAADPGENADPNDNAASTTGGDPLGFVHYR